MRLRSQEAGGVQSQVMRNYLCFPEALPPTFASCAAASSGSKDFQYSLPLGVVSTAAQAHKRKHGEELSCRDTTHACPREWSLLRPLGAPTEAVIVCAAKAHCILT
eukprot:1158440-Pelagomonas_calceolata.AAC.5